MGNPVLVSACRTAIGKFQGSLAPLTAPRLGALAVAEAITRANVDVNQIDEAIMGTVLQAGQGQNPARQAALGAGLPQSVAAFTVNKVCGSGLKSVMLAAQAIKAGDARCIVAGGMESMTNAPYTLPDARAGQRLGHGRLIDSLVADGLWDVYSDQHMGNTAELVAKEYGISREDQDAWAVRSQLLAVEAQKNGKFDAEIFPVEFRGRKGDVTVFDKDEGPRADTTLEKLAALRPAFQKDGTVTAGNASTINDGASALVVADEDWARAQGLPVRARITGYATGGLAPEWVLMAPEVAFSKLCSLTGFGLGDFDLIEINEAFSSQMVALVRKLELDETKVNVHGGGVSLGHPIGCSGARVLTTLLHALEDRGLSRGAAALCLGGGNAVAMSIEVLS
ncbi:MAG: acetyl-CoA C-acetyltransferase [Planctomycetes bacterium]|nr:acetyl-CoA C-acetyltransferase [Planctomycetota bacterium]MCB9917241.1 acetyl-CoA C-acetyltransferase [Planctomycetota bacterium]